MLTGVPVAKCAVSMLCTDIIPYSLNISRLSNVAKNKNFTDLQTLQKCILYGGLFC